MVPSAGTVAVALAVAAAVAFFVADALAVAEAFAVVFVAEGLTDALGVAVFVAFEVAEAVALAEALAVAEATAGRARERETLSRVRTSRVSLVLVGSEGLCARSPAAREGTNTPAPSTIARAAVAAIGAMVVRTRSRGAYVAKLPSSPAKAAGISTASSGTATPRRGLVDTSGVRSASDRERRGVDKRGSPRDRGQESSAYRERHYQGY